MKSPRILAPPDFRLTRRVGALASRRSARHRTARDVFARRDAAGVRSAGIVRACRFSERWKSVRGDSCPRLRSARSVPFGCPM